VSLFDGKSTVPERKYISSDSPPKSPRVRPVRSVESTVDDEGRTVEEMRRMIRKVLNDNLQQVQEVRLLFLVDCSLKQLHQSLTIRHCFHSNSTTLMNSTVNALRKTCSQD
jgi:hypothetical protein